MSHTHADSTRRTSATIEKRNERLRVNARALLQKVEGFTASQREPFRERCVEDYTAAQVPTHRHFTGVSTSNDQIDGKSRHVFASVTNHLMCFVGGRQGGGDIVLLHLADGEVN